MDGSPTSQGSLPSFRSPPRILIPKLVQSRDNWKEKAAQRQRQLKASQIRSRDLTLSRDLWKARALAAEQQLLTLQQQSQQDQRHLHQARLELARLQGEKNSQLG